MNRWSLRFNKKKSRRGAIQIDPTPRNTDDLLLDSVLHKVLFFFTSRRGHTILQGDWSSDVCSSDLLEPLLCPRVCGLPVDAARAKTEGDVVENAEIGRGRVGKECRSRWSPYH